MNTAVIKKASCLALILIMLVILSVHVFARYEGDTEVIARIEPEASFESSSDTSENESSGIASDDTNSEYVPTGDSSASEIFIFLLLASSTAVIIFSCLPKKE